MAGENLLFSSPLPGPRALCQGAGAWGEEAGRQADQEVAPPDPSCQLPGGFGALNVRKMPE